MFITIAFKTRITVRSNVIKSKETLMNFNLTSIQQLVTPNLHKFGITMKTGTSCEQMCAPVCVMFCILF